MRIVIEIDEGKKPKVKVGETEESTPVVVESLTGVTDAGPAPVAAAAPPASSFQDPGNLVQPVEMASPGFDRNAGISAGAAPGSE